MEQIGDRAYLYHRLSRDFPKFSQDGCIALRSSSVKSADQQAGGGEILSCTVMQFPGNSPAFFILDPKQRTRKVFHRTTCTTQFVDYSAEKEHRNRHSHEKELESKNVSFPSFADEYRRFMEVLPG